MWWEGVSHRIRGGKNGVWRLWKGYILWHIEWGRLMRRPEGSAATWLLFNYPRFRCIPRPYVQRGVWSCQSPLLPLSRVLLTWKRNPPHRFYRANTCKAIISRRVTTSSPRTAFHFFSFFFFSYSVNEKLHGKCVFPLTFIKELISDDHCWTY